MRSTATTSRPRKSVSICPAAAASGHARVRSIGKDGTRLRRIGRRRLLPRAADLRPVDHRREAEPADEGARVEGLVHADERILAAQARPRHERHRSGLRLQGQGVPGPVEQGMPSVAARHERARRGGSPHAGLSHAAHLQRRRQFCRRRARGARSRPGKSRTARAGSTCHSGGRSTRSSARRSSTATSCAARVAAFKMEDKSRQDRAYAGLALARHGSGRAARRRATASCSRTAAARTRRRPTSTLGLGFNTAANRVARSTHATIYALDARTGKELWSSGDQITSFNHFSGLSVANGRVYIGTYDGTLYCFGVDGASTSTQRPLAARRESA